MKTELKEVSPTQREIHIEIDAETVKAAYGKAVAKYAKRAVVPGFRKGFAPADVVKIRYKEEIRSEVLQAVIPTQVTDAIREHDLNPLTEPHLHLENPDTVVVNGTEPLSLHIHVEVMPEVATPNYKGIEVTRRVRPVDDKEVEDLINERLTREAALIPVEGRASELGDTVVVDLQGKFDDAPDEDPITADDLEVVLGGENIEAAFTDNLVGVSEDEEKEFTVAYPANFSSEALAGKTVHYKAKVKSVGRSEVPELNDDWAKSLDEGYDSLADLRTRLRADVEKMAIADADARLRNDAIAKVIEDNKFEVPNTLIENQARNLLNNFAHDLQQRGIDPSKVQKDFIELAYANMRTQAERDVRGAILLDKIAEAENVSVDDAEVEEEVVKLSEYYRVPAKEIRESLEKQGGLDNIRNNLKTRKSIEAVVSAAKVTEGEWIDEAAALAAAQEAASGKADGDEKPKKKKAAPKKKVAKEA
ncbi:MAG: trigger factor [Acidobacteria bacterium ACB1]|nr:Trigger factor [Pyrinomonadaceae bacterium]MCE7962177.1 trigger factor [Acidobacteria bacterium ACB1]RIJ89499.1 MAG: trigger factor [Acidobacteriota bacterium]